MSLYSNGIAPKQLAQLVDDTEAAQSQAAVMDQALENFNALSAKLDALKTKFSGELVLVANDTGVAPAGSSRASGLFVPRTAYGQQKFSVTNGLTSFSANSSNKLWLVTANAAIQYYDYGTGATTTGTMFISSMTPRGVAATDEALYVFGGESSSSGGPMALCYRYLASTNTVSSLPSLPAARARAAVAIQANGAILVLGGLTTATANAASASNSITRYNPTANTHETLAAVLPFRCWGAKTSRRADGTILILAAAGNATDDGVTLAITNRAALFNPTTGTCIALDSGGGYGTMGLLADNRTVVMGTPTLAKAINPQAAAGSQWTDYPLTAPTGLISIDGPSGSFSNAVRGEYLPVTLSFGGASTSGLFWTGSTPSNAGNSFYVTVDT